MEKIRCYLLLFFITVFLSFLSGCMSSKFNKRVSHYPSGSTYQTSGYFTDNDIENSETKLSEAAVSVSHSLDQLAAIEKASHPKDKLPTPPNPDLIGLGGLASIDWVGPAEPLIQRLASAGEYKFRVVGRRPAIPVMVSIYDANMPLADILRDVNYQAGKKADIMIYPSRRTIELRYR